MLQLSREDWKLLEQQQTDGTLVADQRRWAVKITKPLRGGKPIHLGPFTYRDAVNVYVNLPLPCEVIDAGADPGWQVGQIINVVLRT